MNNIVLFQPEIPANTGNIARTCVGTNTRLHLIRPLGFSIDDKHVKRAGLDYWEHLDLVVWDSFEEFLEKGLALSFNELQILNVLVDTYMYIRDLYFPNYNKVPNYKNRLLTVDNRFLTKNDLIGMNLAIQYVSHLFYGLLDIFFLNIFHQKNT